MKTTPTHFAIMGDDGLKRIWFTAGLWVSSKNLPSRSMPIDAFDGLDKNTWFFGKEPTCRLVTEHARRINEASLAYPIILSAEGWVMDGMHRICKALMLEMDAVNVVQFAENSAPDEVV